MLPSASLDGVGTSDDIDFRAQYPACACPCQRSTPSLAADGVWLRVGVARYAFPARLFHPLLSARFTGAFQDSLPAAGQAFLVGSADPLGPSQSFRVLYISSSLPRLGLSHINLSTAFLLSVDDMFAPERCTSYEGRNASVWLRLRRAVY